LAALCGEGGRTVVREVPPVERVRAGLWSVPVPIPNNPLGYTLVYVFETDRGPVLVDAGWDDDTTWKALGEGLLATGHDVDDCYGVLVTHMHPDHHGLSGRVREASGAWIAMHPQDAFVLQRRFEIDDEWLMQAAGILLDSGAPDEAVASLPTLDEIGRMKPPELPDRHLTDGERVDVPGWDVRAVWTPGHSPGHTCFNVGGDVLLTGDHVLPEITPHIGLYRIDDQQHDPLGDYLHSLLRVSAEVVNEVLPAHQHRFAGLPGRVGELLAHHEERLDAIERSLLVRPETSWDIAAAMPWNRAWDDLGIIMKRTALSEAFAHIRYLEHQGRVERVGDGTPVCWQLTRSRAAALTAGQ
jgi:glyoxylase-like metal-dependent hydrolase (beta-lactamase superfamily II)